MRALFRIIEKIFVFLVWLPPIYMVYRFVRWYLRQQKEPEET